MFRRALGTTATCSATSAAASVSRRSYTELSHMKYPVYYNAVGCVAGYFAVMWVVFCHMGAQESSRGQYKHDYLRVWRRKLGTGYQWADAWGPQMDTLFKDLPEEVE
ncbi:putative mitochondrial hypothetical protein [Leptomonas pyrrhocoris]|uniref:Uncharacterized protein n=1 Tax=Leptomonas pyrrhocoris TaxID=157538 RepID=A0A0M9G0Y4_LEPPY|nr:putative mitochondrial hypothetical protein [Leptomonas pyrrhocoris]KPA80105.1 putative mitochondrial hypothetical protein [Leptomonas pyrrhocoris]|eukprot:XP_015658544.1 putative mitochondrial hypothetical protein [Leptomonas pyrrhocoris]